MASAVLTSGRGSSRQWTDEAVALLETMSRYAQDDILTRLRAERPRLLTHDDVMRAVRSGLKECHP